VLILGLPNQQRHPTENEVKRGVDFGLLKQSSKDESLRKEKIPKARVSHERRENSQQDSHTGTGDSEQELGVPWEVSSDRKPETHWGMRRTKREGVLSRESFKRGERGVKNTQSTKRSKRAHLIQTES